VPVPFTKENVDNLSGSNIADGSPIDPIPQVVPTSSFQNAKRVSRGPNTGKLKDAGVFTKKAATVVTQEDEDTVTSKKGFIKISFLNNARLPYNRGSDTKVIASFTRQMENDEKVIAIRPGSYGIGFTNKVNFHKSRGVEVTCKKRIYALTTEEENAVRKIAEQQVEEKSKK
jgi:hypothetical protein